MKSDCLQFHFPSVEACSPVESLTWCMGLQFHFPSVEACSPVESLTWCMGTNRCYSQPQGCHSETPKMVTVMVLTLCFLQKCII